MDHYYAVIMAGGGGTRLWPLSRISRPKQMLRLGGDRTLYQIAIDRLNGLFPPERIIVVTVADQAGELQRQIPEIPVENFLLEPLPRGTASVVGLAAAALYARDPDSTMAVLTADHVIKNVEYFQALLRGAFEIAGQGYLVTLGIHPTHPATGYGYLQRGNILEMESSLPVFEVKRFKEKPDLESAKTMLAQGDHYWNSGMFVWKTSRIREELQRWMPELAEALAKIEQKWDTPERPALINDIWPAIQPQTIDYGIMERAERTAVLPAVDLGWNDIGSWDALFEVLPGDENGNILIHSDVLTLDSRESLILSENPDRLIAAIGVQNLIIIDTGEILLVCNRDDAQNVREAVRLLKKNHRDRYL